MPTDLTTWPASSIENRDVEALLPYARNARMHSDSQVAQIAASVQEWGWTVPVLIDEENGIIAGHGRIMAARKLGLSEVPCMVARNWSDAQKKAYIIADNKLALNADWDEDMLRVELEELKSLSFEMPLTGFSEEEIAELFGDDREHPEGTSTIGDRGVLRRDFLCPPFSVLNAREGWWQDRKAAWIALGLKSELGRLGEAKEDKNDNGGLLLSTWTSHPRFYMQKTAMERKLGREIPTQEFIEEYWEPPDDIATTGVSIFDPCLTEIMYSWFSMKGGKILDPFAGGSTRGIVASACGRGYQGHELRQEQVEANREQWLEIIPTLREDERIEDDGPHPIWVEGDSNITLDNVEPESVDLIFSCPPYADLERYSDDPADISTMEYSEFRKVYSSIVAKACKALRKDRFAVFVVGEARDKKGHYYDFVGDTVQAFRDAGLSYYNEMILVTALGSAPVRATGYFKQTRKVAKTHQNILVFIKGDGKAATEACGIVEFGDLMEEGEDDGGFEILDDGELGGEL